MAPQGDLPWLLQPPSSSTDPNVILWCPGAGGSPDIQMFSGNTGVHRSAPPPPPPGPRGHRLPEKSHNTFGPGVVVLSDLLPAAPLYRAISLYSFLCVWHHLNRETYEGPAGQTSEGPPEDRPTRAL
ncbi:unnamed protein product [Gadus morhua 'NCC']